MDDKIIRLLDRIGETYKEHIAPDARHYIEVNIGRKAREMGYEELFEPFRETYAIVPLKTPRAGMKVRIDGRTFVNYRRHHSGIAIPEYVARAAGTTLEAFIARDSMVLNCA